MLCQCVCMLVYARTVYAKHIVPLLYCSLARVGRRDPLYLNEWLGLSDSSFWLCDPFVMSLCVCTHMCTCVGPYTVCGSELYSCVCFVYSLIYEPLRARVCVYGGGGGVMPSTWLMSYIPEVNPSEDKGTGDVCLWPCLLSMAYVMMIYCRLGCNSVLKSWMWSTARQK